MCNEKTTAWRAIVVKLLDRWRFRGDPKRSYRSDYETLVRLARRCAYDFSHTVDVLPDDHYYIKDFGMRERADWWVALFAKGNPGKDYRMELQRRVDKAESELDRLHEWCAAQGLSPPDGRDIPF